MCDLVRGHKLANKILFVIVEVINQPFEIEKTFQFRFDASALDELCVIIYAESVSGGGAVGERVDVTQQAHDLTSAQSVLGLVPHS
jgi:hypothetical protein